MNISFYKKISVLLVISLILGTNTAFAATPKSDHEITKYDIRADFYTAATLSSRMFPIASKELKHSLQNNPSNRGHNSSSAAAKKLHHQQSTQLY